ncbi:hypothetical protein [Lentibacillus sediminis]|uniref:hypothetical protein n=1 Tax=Lentibacillus sediminis TaxID=1940529 RepID=UPI000C1C1D6C|nr:hypothetical protein [Lentibacillus sediminis]
MTSYIFVIAAWLAALPTLVLFKKYLDQLKKDPSQSQAVLQKFSIGASVSEIIPIILLVYGFTQVQAVQDASELFIPGILILLLLVLIVIFIFMQRMVDVEPEAKQNVGNFANMALGLSCAIPIACLVALFTMMP